MKLKETIAKMRIPKNTSYCYTPKGWINGNGTIPYMKIKKCPYFRKKYNKEWKCDAEYCKYIHDFLSIQDMVKDCGINDD